MKLVETTTDGERAYTLYLGFGRKLTLTRRTAGQRELFLVSASFAQGDGAEIGMDREGFQLIAHAADELMGWRHKQERIKAIAAAVRDEALGRTFLPGEKLKDDHPLVIGDDGRIYNEYREDGWRYVSCASPKEGDRIYLLPDNNATRAVEVVVLSDTHLPSTAQWKPVTLGGESHWRTLDMLDTRKHRTVRLRGLDGWWKVDKKGMVASTMSDNDNVLREIPINSDMWWKP
jgi:hypothetical protein